MSIMRKDIGLIYTFDPYEDEPWRQALEDMYADGVRGISFLCPLPLAWREDGRFDFTLLDELTDEIFSIAPEAQLLPRAFLTTPDWWDARHEEELLKFDGPAPRVVKFHRSSQKLWRYEDKMYHATRNPSVASGIWRRDAANAVSAYAAHLLERYGLSGVYGIHLAYGTCGEWGQFGSYTNGQFANADFSRPMVMAFRRYLIGRYGDHPDFHTILPPSKTERMQTENGMLRSPAFFRRQLDYFICAATEQLNAIRFFARAVKKIHPHLKTGCFGLGLMTPGTSAYQLHQLPVAVQGLQAAEIPELDFISTPNGYFDRKQGMFSQTPERSVSLRKVLIAECDVRTGYAGDPYSPAESDSLNQFLFETGYNLTAGSGRFWLYDFGRHWYRDSEIRAAIRRIARLCSVPPDPLPQAEIAVVIDPESVVCSEGSSGYYRSFLRFLSGELPRCGVPYDCIVMDDFFRCPPYKLYLFRDKFLTSPEESARIRRFLETHHASAVWFGPAGAVRSEGVDFSCSRFLTGFELRSLSGITGSNSVTLCEHPLLQNLPLPYSLTPVEDCNAVYSPVLTGSGGEVLGVVESTGLPGCLLRQSNGRFDLWSSFPVLPLELLRTLFAQIGLIPRISGSAVCYGAGKRFVIRADRDGEVAIRTASIELQNLISGETYRAVNGNAVIAMSKGQTLLLSE